jgi:pimeloyl-ACP methyl ester carboxylesterase
VGLRQNSAAEKIILGRVWQEFTAQEEPLGGEDDPIHPIESQADIAAAVPPHLVQFERFPNCWHAVIPATPERAMAAIRDFKGLAT